MNGGVGRAVQETVDTKWRGATSEAQTGLGRRGEALVESAARGYTLQAERRGSRGADVQACM